jgi:hypothetical protein
VQYAAHAPRGRKQRAAREAPAAAVVVLAAVGETRLVRDQINDARVIREAETTVDRLDREVVARDSDRRAVVDETDAEPVG